MHAAISTVAKLLLDRMVSTLPINGSMAALARWNSNRQPAKIKSGLFRIRSPGLMRGFFALLGGEPWARSGSISAGEIEAEHQQRRSE